MHSSPRLGRPDQPVMIVVSDRWESATESGWITRQVAGALACVADVHVVTAGDSQPNTISDGVFTVHRSGPGIGADHLSAVSADVQAEGMVMAGRHWQAMAETLEGLHSDLPATVLVLEHERAADEEEAAVSRVARRSQAIMVVTHSAASWVERQTPSANQVRIIGAPMAVNPMVLDEPDPMLAGAEYVLVLTASREGSDNLDTGLARILRVRYPDATIAILHSDAFCVWRRGRVERVGPVERSSDLERLMAWAQVTVDLCPGGLFARRCVSSLLFGTPIVVPRDSRAREHAEYGRGGLWFTSPAELSWCVETMLDPSTRSAFSAQGKAYADREFGSTDQFIERVTASCGFTATDTDSRAVTEGMTSRGSP